MIWRTSTRILAGLALTLTLAADPGPDEDVEGPVHRRLQSAGAGGRRLDRAAADAEELGIEKA